MGRRVKPVKGKADARALARKSPKDESAKPLDLEKRLGESLEREQATRRALTDALDRETATSEILRVISSSPNDLQPVLDAMAKSAARLCDTNDSTIIRLDGDDLRLVAHHGPNPVPTAFVLSAN